MPLDGLVELARRDDAAIVGLILLGQLGREEVEIRPANQSVEGGADGPAEALVPEREATLEILTEDELRQTLDERGVEPLRFVEGGAKRIGGRQVTFGHGQAAVRTHRSTPYRRASGFTGSGPGQRP